MTTATKQQIANRTIFEGDNLDILRGMNSDSVDLIYLDPPFNSNANYAAPIGSSAAGAAFKDTWTWDDVKAEEHGLIADQEPALYDVIKAAGAAHGKGMMAYLIMMASRMIELKRVLKPEGTIYLHCDDSADYYLRMLMDAIYGESNWQATIHRRRTSSHNDKVFGRVMDTIHVYGAPPKNDVLMELDPEHVATSYRYQDQRGRFTTDQLTGPKTSAGESGQPWGGYDPTNIGRCWSVPRTGKYAGYIEKRFIAGYTKIKGIHDRLDALDKAGLIYRTSSNVPRLKRYLMPDQKQLASNLWLDCKDNQKTAYPTEKSLEALKRIIEASSNEGDMVLDPFCGCATACIAAEQLERQWIGIDLSPLAVKLVEKRARDELGLMGGIQSIHRTDVPKRTDLGQLPNYRTHKRTLFGEQEGVCNGCLVAFPFRNFTVDHIVPRNKGGHDHIDNLQLLCGACNSTKGNGSMAELIAKLREQGIRD